MKKILTFAVILSLALCLCPGITVGATDAQNVAFDFSTADVAAQYPYTTDYAADGKSGAVKVKMNKDTVIEITPQITDWSAYKSLSLSAASKNTYPIKMHIRIEFGADAGLSDNAYAIKKNININSAGFRNYSVDLSDFELLNARDKDNPSVVITQIPWGYVEKVYFEFEGWGVDETEVDSSDTFYFDELTLSESPTAKSSGVTPYEDTALDGEYVLNKSGHIPNQCEPSKNVKAFATRSAHWNKVNFSYEVPLTGVELAEYKTINILMYNEGETDKTMLVQFMEDVPGDATQYEIKKFVVDKTGWQVIRIPISSFKNIDKATGTINIYAHGWEIDYRDGNTTAYFDKIWLDKKTTTEVSEMPDVGTSDAKEIYSAILNNTGSYIVYDKHIAKVDESKPNVYDMTAQAEVEARFVVVQNKVLVDYPKADGHIYKINIAGMYDEEGKEINKTYISSVSSSGLSSVGKFDVKNTAADIENSSVKAEFRYENGTDTSKSAVLIVAVYNDSGRLISVKTENYENLVPGRCGSLEIDYTGDFDGYKVKVMAFNSMLKPIPLTTDVTVTAKQ